MVCFLLDRTLVTSFPALLVAMFALEVAGTLDASDSQRVYAREATAGDAVAVDVENAPRVAVALAWPLTSLEVEYAPRIFWSDVGSVEASPALLLHNGALRLTTREERLSASLAQTFAIGDQSFSRLSFDRESLATEPGASAGVDLVPGPSVVRVVAAETSASLRYEWSRRVSTELRPSLGVTGGETTAAQQVLPRQRTARVEASLAYRTSQRNTLTTEAGVEQTSVSNDYDHAIVSLTETWSRTFAPESGTALGAGIAYQETEPPVGETEQEVQPIGRARVWHTIARHAVHVQLSSELGYQPHINVLTGTLQRQLYVSGAATAAAGTTTARLALGAAQTFPLEQPDTAKSISADLALEQAITTWLSAEVGGQVVWQSLGVTGALGADDALWLVFAGAQAELPTTRF